MFDKYQINGNYLDHEFDDLLTGERRIARYWLPDGGGYVRVDNSYLTRMDYDTGEMFPVEPKLNKYGTLGSQPTTNDGSKWWCTSMISLKKRVKAQRRQERAEYVGRA